ncbi:hypothetical protein KEN51_CDS0275 [Pseudomonas phage vB_Pae10145-KEN51]|uniref:PHIKZ122 n=8 Tax=root TaxID=1 RepID=Q8SD40_BPDPK|nr:hypothetical protein [Pseudomonas aeruginosa]NP_803688.1 PHIKZ122 [Pseudomonas phage phiKZ]YP_009617539.1 hypothetical protein FDI90_gp251 [Pseudomonas phage PA7]YP_009619762.1 hypothetical protein FDJ06_gp222 [Pseudomonas phage SL2]ANM44915.1 hypothetical protein KTN4_157 [Pseudomonas phage KTN4]QJB22793.1 hypothetical protein fnug_150 [Pseudomonas phage fnug]QOV08005.1 hypothetical protein [Pseudomonas phage vB_PaeM_kmuB]QYV98987.1 hypothetical protein [Pseudomonas phage T2P]QYV99313.1
MVTLKIAGLTQVSVKPTIDHPYDKKSGTAYTKGDPYANWNLPVSRFVEYRNESFHRITVVDSSGHAINIGTSRKYVMSNRLVVKVIYRWSGDDSFNYEVMAKSIPGFTPEEMLEYIQSFSRQTFDQFNNQLSEITIWYSIDLSKLVDQYHGGWIQSLGIQVFKTEYSQYFEFYPNRNISPPGYSGLSPEEEALSNQVWNETYSLTYNTDINKPDKLFYVMAGRIMAIESIYNPSLDPGLIVNIRGKHGCISHNGEKRYVIPPEQFHENGFFRTHEEAAAMVGIKDKKVIERLKTALLTAADIKEREAQEKAAGTFDKEFKPKDVVLIHGLKWGDLNSIASDLVSSIKIVGSLMDLILPKV